MFGAELSYFARYKIVDLHLLCDRLRLSPRSILDFGCGIGNSAPPFKELFPQAAVTFADVSARSLAVAKAQFPDHGRFLMIDGDRLEIDDNSVDVVFTACVFHHIDHQRHRHWAGELLRVLRPGGLLMVYEHNPYNPLTVRVVNTCPFDADAHLVPPRQLRATIAGLGGVDVQTRYRTFFPQPLAALRPLERGLTWLPLGAQYYLSARKRPGRTGPTRALNRDQKRETVKCPS